MRVLNWYTHNDTGDIFCLIERKNGLFSWGYYSWEGQLMVSNHQYWYGPDAEREAQELWYIPE